MSAKSYAPGTSAVNPDCPSSPERGVLRADEFYTYEALMRRLPEKTSEDAIRRLISTKSLPVHRIGGFRWFFGAELIAASRDTSIEPDE